MEISVKLKYADEKDYWCEPIGLSIHKQNIQEKE